ncbi:MAG: SecDF P1 head subdomain-containing protein [Bacteroidales bacterium]
MLTFCLLLLISGFSMAQTEEKNRIPDGLYLVTALGNDTAQSQAHPGNHTAVNFNYDFISKSDMEYDEIRIDTSEFVPLELENLPTTEQQTATKKKLLFSLTTEASEKLHTFTANHIMDKVALVVDGKAVSIHKIREPVTGGQLQITTCSDNACERLIVRMQNNMN